MKNMTFDFKTPQEGMPEENEPVLVHLDEGSEWAIAYYGGSKWWFDVPSEAFDQVAHETGQRLPVEMVEVGFRRITHWARLPKIQSGT
ncbi:MAG TPA: hypothetical protein VLB76_22725 [Thermoanaerobaculia bacterium]|jgi:hypothetical protein|nr:hypothetical protein [Thermoanaerobaculia bacterium]